MGLLYLGNSLFRKHLYEHVIYPCKNPEKYHPDHLPLKRAFGIFGQKGNQKAAVVGQLLREANIPFATLSVKFGTTLDFCGSFDELMATRIKHPTPQPHVVIIDHADILIHEPDDKEVTLLATQFLERAEEANVLIVALFDRQRGDPNPYKDAFFAQFPFISVLSTAAADNKGFIVDFYKHKFDSFCKHYDLQNALQELEYQMLADVSAYATIDDMTLFCQRIFNELFQLEATVLDFDLHVKKHIVVSGNFQHIDTIMYQMAKVVDEQFTSMIGIMNKQVGAKVAKGKREREDEEGEGLLEAKKQLKRAEDEVNVEELKEGDLEEMKLKFE
jgi:hypothetical protein